MTDHERAARALAARITEAAHRGELPARMAPWECARAMGMDPFRGVAQVVAAMEHLAAAGVIQLRDDDALVLMPRRRVYEDQLTIGED